jgi:hypothetical protein
VTQKTAGRLAPCKEGRRPVQTKNRRNQQDSINTTQLIANVMPISFNSKNHINYQAAGGFARYAAKN